MGKFEKLCNEYRENKRMIEELTAINDGLKADIIGLMGGAETYTEGAAKASNKLVVSARFDSTGFKRDFPDIYCKYSRETAYNRFTVG